MSARPELVLFDAVGTLIEPVPSAGEVYRDCARRFGYDRDDPDQPDRILELRELAISLGHQPNEQTDDSLESFEYERDLILAMHDVAITLRMDREGQTDEAFEFECWRQVVRNYFEDRSHAEADEMFVELWQHFARASNWRLFPDVEPTIAELKRRGYRLGIASNFDGRLLEICRDLPPLDTLDPIFVSSQVGWSKPYPNFYAEIERITQLPPERIFMVGDDCGSDQVFPRGRGWQACWLCRIAESSTAGTNIRSLTEILDQLPG